MLRTRPYAADKPTVSLPKTLLRFIRFSYRRPPLSVFT